MGLKPLAVRKRTDAERNNDKATAQARIERWRDVRADLRSARAALPATGGTQAQRRDRAIIAGLLALGQLVMLVLGSADADDREG